LCFPTFEKAQFVSALGIISKRKNIIMATFKVLITDGLDESGQSILRDSAQVDDRNNISAEDLLKEIPAYDGLIVRGRTKVTASVMEAATNLKVIGRAGVGVDNIDLEAAKKHNITVVTRRHPQHWLSLNWRLD
jgi:phosphoglycerate dehydrogenase-like enzyme